NGDKSLRVVMIDFGSAQLIDDSMSQYGIMRPTGGTEDFEAPENRKCGLKPAADIYSLGATLHYFIQEEDIECEAMDVLVKMMMDPAPENRPRAREIVEKAKAIQQMLKPIVLGPSGMSLTIITTKEAIPKLPSRSSRSKPTSHTFKATGITPTRHHIFYEIMGRTTEAAFKIMENIG
ncbi:hypothetical protein THASP1DRAFT_26660, partial [Thamnocephalis sphaerospora]